MAERQQIASLLRMVDERRAIATMEGTVYGYAGKFLRVDLSRQSVAEEKLEQTVLRSYIGGTGIGAKFLYDEVLPETAWSDPENRLILAAGPLNGTRIGGSGTFSVVTKGALTNGATSSQANGFLGAYLRFSGFDGIIIQGQAPRLVYLYVHDGMAEIKDASHLTGKDTKETESIIKKELAKSDREMSVYSIGPAGENLVKFAMICGDKGHVAAHNGVGAVLGSKKLKAIAVARSKASIPLKDRQRLSEVARELKEDMKNDYRMDIYRWGTLGILVPGLKTGVTPVKNYLTNIYDITEEKLEKFGHEYIREHFRPRPSPCWACQAQHCGIVTIPDGPHKGLVTEEPDYECLAAWGPIIGQTDVDTAIMLADYVDRLGMDANEGGWLIAWVMECYEKGILGREDIDGLDMTWGNAEAVKGLLYRIAHRLGFGDILANGVMRAAQHIGGEAVNFAIHTRKGNTPRGHDHRTRWDEFFDTCVSNTGTIETRLTIPDLSLIGAAPITDRFSPEQISTNTAKTKGSMQFEDSLVVCRFNTRTDLTRLCQALSAATGWDFTVDEAMQMGRRVVNLLRAFNIRHGITSDMDAPSPRYGSAPIDGPTKGRDIMPFWDSMLSNYYELMGWDKKTGKPLPETLSRLGLGHVVSHLWSRE